MGKPTQRPRPKRELDALWDYAFSLYLSGETQKSIAAKTGLTEATISKYAKTDDWERQRKVINVVCSIENNTLQVNTWFEIEQHPKIVEKTKGSRSIDPRWRYRRDSLRSQHPRGSLYNSPSKITLRYKYTQKTNKKNDSERKT